MKKHLIKLKIVIKPKIRYYIVSNKIRNPKFNKPESPETARSGEDSNYPSTTLRLSLFLGELQ